MLSPYAPPQDDPPLVGNAQPLRGVLWVLQAAVALLAITAWVVVMLHVLLVVRAEYKLRSLLDEARVYSELPEVSRTELTSFVLQNAAKQGYDGASVAVVADTYQPHLWRAVGIRVPAKQCLPPNLQRLAECWGAAPQIEAAADRVEAGFFQR